MQKEASGAVIGSLVTMVLVAVTLVPSIGGPDVDAVPTRERTTGNRAVPAPLVLAQGRCFN
jgi:hypothetical protein